MMLSRLGGVKCSKTIERFNKMGYLTSEDGLSSLSCVSGRDAPMGQSRYVMCKTCMRSLCRPGLLMPKFSLANSNATGELPEEFASATRAEINLVSLVAVKAGIVILSGGKQRALKGHAYFYDLDRAPAAETLPRVAGDIGQNGVMRVVFAGERTSAADLATRRHFSVRRGVVDGLLVHLNQHNHFYKLVVVDEDALATLSDEQDGAFVPGVFVGVSNEGKG
eukprot:TRINITY_DN4118_c0_g1_i3.p2 TRINITY_DN4118_c0_g1~~TRINITY_DN4118_c0_g1_i3.p2  ORF type:complete len:222 (+),score=43.73 TRINITY_DN4118_c0_g1_i3:1838-2503(+)